MPVVAKFFQTDVLPMYHELKEDPDKFLHKTVVQADVYPFATAQMAKTGLRAWKPHPDARNACIIWDVMTESSNFSMCSDETDLTSEIAFCKE